MTPSISLRDILRGFAAPTALFVFHVIADAGFRVYVKLPWFDVPMHFLGGVMIAILVGSFYKSFRRAGIFPALSRMAYVALGTCIVVMFAVWWEFAEFLIDQVFGTTFQPSLADTMLDLLLGMAGGKLMLLINWTKE